MQRWRFIRYVTFALVLVGAPAWLNAQEPAKKAAGWCRDRSTGRNCRSADAGGRWRERVQVFRILK